MPNSDIYAMSIARRPDQALVGAPRGLLHRELFKQRSESSGQRVMNNRHVKRPQRASCFAFDQCKRVCDQDGRGRVGLRSGERNAGVGAGDPFR